MREQITKNPDALRCGVVIRKSPDEQGTPCPNEAEFLIQIADPDDPTHSTISAIILMCKRHADKFDLGRTVVAIDGSGNLIMVKSEDTLSSGDDAS